MGPFIAFLLNFSIFLLEIFSIASQPSCKAKFKISSKSIEKCTRKSKKGSFLVLSLFVLSCLIFVTVILIFDGLNSKLPEVHVHVRWGGATVFCKYCQLEFASMHSMPNHGHFGSLRRLERDFWVGRFLPRESFAAMIR